MNAATLARGKWRGILMALGMEEKYLQRGKHGPCPFCGGTDRYRWDDKDRAGTFICNQCGNGDGFEILKRLKGWDFKTAAQEVERAVGHVRYETAPSGPSEREIKERQRQLWSRAVPITEGDLAWQYLASRNVLPAAIPACLRFIDRCPVPGGDFAPAMLAAVSDVNGKGVNIHRTFLGPNGKADMEDARAMMQGAVPEGSAIRLYPVTGARIGIAEGIETAIAAAKRHRVPTWAAVDAGKLAKWTPPAGVSEVLIFGDCDHSYTGQAAAYTLANRVATRLRLAVQVHIPEKLGRDWADEAA